MPTSTQKVVIVGGGFGGIKAAMEMAEDRRLDVTLITERDHFLYYPALYATATGRSRAQSIVPIDQIIGRYPRLKLVIDSVTGINVDRRHVKLASGGHQDYDRLVLALGVVTNYFGIDGLAEHSYSIKSSDEVSRFKDHLHKALAADHHVDKHYVVVGAGPTGVELSAALATYLKRIAVNHDLKRAKIRLSLIEAAPRVLPRMKPAASAKVQRHLESLGVKVRVGAKVERQDKDRLIVNGRPLATHTVIWTSGVSNHPLFAAHNDLFELGAGGRVVVDDQLMAAPGIFVIGDNAATPYCGLAQTALHDGQFVARVIRAELSGHQAPVYQAVKPPVVVPAGDDWAIFEWGPLVFGGRPAAWLRRAADAIGYHDILPIGHALEAWRAEDLPEESCQVCRQAI